MHLLNFLLNWVLFAWFWTWISTLLSSLFLTLSKYPLFPASHLHISALLATTSFNSAITRAFIVLKLLFSWVYSFNLRMVLNYPPWWSFWASISMWLRVLFKLFSAMPQNRLQLPRINAGFSVDFLFERARLTLATHKYPFSRPKKPHMAATDLLFSAPPQ